MLQKVYAKFRERLVFEPIIYTFSSTNAEFISKNCVSRGAFCAFGREDNDAITGRVVIREALRQACIFKLNVDDFFQYTRAFYTSCFNTFSENCSQELVKATGLEWNDISRCVDHSFEGVNQNYWENDNGLLSANKEQIKLLGAQSFPNVYFNEKLYKGSLSYNDMLLAICGALNGQSAECANIQLEVEEDLDVIQMIILTLVGFVAGVIILGFICKQIAKRKYLRLIY